MISCSLTIDRAVLQGPHRAENRGSGASALPQTAGFGRWAKAEPTCSSEQRMDARNAGSGVHARPGRLLTPRARGGASGSPQNRRLCSIRSRCRGLKCSAKMGVLTVISGLRWVLERGRSRRSCRACWPESCCGRGEVLYKTQHIHMQPCKPPPAQCLLLQAYVPARILRATG